MNRSETSHDPLKLIRCYIDGNITPYQLEELEALLRDEDSVREQFLSEVNLATSLEYLASNEIPFASPALNLEDNARFKSSLAWTNSPITAWVLAFAALLLIAITAILFVYRDDAMMDIATVTGIAGQVEWTDTEGLTHRELEIGQVLSAGTIESIGADSWIELTFSDQSSIAVSGHSLVSFSEGDRKRVDVRYGRISADIQAQRDGASMLIETPAALMEVLGTQFDVDARSTETHLSVSEGRVRIRRLVDDADLDVPEMHRVVATLDPSLDLTLSRRSANLTSWQGDLREDLCFGEWVSQSESLANRLKKQVAAGILTSEEAIIELKETLTMDPNDGSAWATPIVVGSKDNSAVRRSNLEMLIWLSASQSEGPVSITEDATLRVRGRFTYDTDQLPTLLEFGIGTHGTNRGLTEKFSSMVSAEELNPNEQGIFELVLPVTDFDPNDSNEIRSPVHQELSDWWCSYNAQAKLEILEIELFGELIVND